MTTMTNFTKSKLIAKFDDIDNERFHTEDNIEVGVPLKEQENGACIALRTFENSCHSHVNLSASNARKLGELLIAFANEQEHK